MGRRRHYDMQQMSVNVQKKKKKNLIKAWNKTSGVCIDVDRWE